MNSGINLLENKQLLAGTSATPSGRRLLVVRTIALFLLFGIASFSIIIFLFIALSPLPALQKQEQAARATLSAQHGDVAKLLLVHDRVSGAETILHTRSQFDKVLDEIRKKMPSELAVTGLVIADKTISITVTSKSLAALDTFINNMLTITGKNKNFSELTLTNFFIDEGRSVFTLTLTMT